MAPAHSILNPCSKQSKRTVGFIPFAASIADVAANGSQLSTVHRLPKLGSGVSTPVSLQRSLLLPQNFFHELFTNPTNHREGWVINIRDSDFTSLAKQYTNH